MIELNKYLLVMIVFTTVILGTAGGSHFISSLYSNASLLHIKKAETVVKLLRQVGVVTHTFSHRPWEAEAGRFL